MAMWWHWWYAPLYVLVGLITSRISVWYCTDKEGNWKTARISEARHCGGWAAIWFFFWPFVLPVSLIAAVLFGVVSGTFLALEWYYTPAPKRKAKRHAEDQESIPEVEGELVP